MTIEQPSSIVAMAEWVRSLPLESLAPVGVLFVGGLLLLAFGQRILKPVLVVAAIFAGVVLAVRFGHSLGSTISPLVWSIIGAFAAVLVVAVSYRIALGVAVGAVAAVAAMLLATAAAEFGLVDVGAKPTETTSAALRATDDDANDTLLLDRLRAQAGAEGHAVVDAEARESVAARLDDVSPGLGPAFLGWLDRSNAFFAHVGEWTRERWDAMPKPMRTLLLASGAAGFFLGFVAGLMSPVWAAAMITSLFGGLLTVGAGVPLLSRVVAPEAMPQFSPLGWLLLWLTVSFVGWLFQWWTRPGPKKVKQAVAVEAEPQRA